MQDLQTPRTLLPSSEESHVELERMQNVLLLLDNLAQREEATVKSILDCLYDVGSARLINQKVNVKVLRGPLKGIARFSKPVFRIFALRWFKRNFPRLTTHWLYKQVRFGGRPPIENGNSTLLDEQDDSDLIDVVPVRDALPPLVEKQAAEINALRDRVGWLTAAVVLMGVLGCYTLLH